MPERVVAPVVWGDAAAGAAGAAGGGGMRKTGLVSNVLWSIKGAMKLEMRRGKWPSGCRGGVELASTTRTALTSYVLWESRCRVRWLKVVG